MARLTKKKYLEYKAININGLTVNIGRLLHQYAYGDEYPQFNIILLENEKIQLDFTISYFKFYDGRGEYRIKVAEYKKSEGSKILTSTSDRNFQKTYFTETTLKGVRFSFKRLKEICQGLDFKELKTTILNDYEAFKGVG